MYTFYRPCIFHSNRKDKIRLTKKININVLSPGIIDVDSLETNCKRATLFWGRVLVLAMAVVKIFDDTIFLTFKTLLTGGFCWMMKDSKEHDV